MMTAAQQSSWQQPNGIAAIHAWIRQQLAAQRIAITGEIAEVKMRPWSLVLRVPTVMGDVYFKAAASFAMHEPALVQHLYRQFPTQVLAPLAVDKKRAWMLLPDGEQALRDVLKVTPDWSHWENVLPQYARLQASVADDHAALLALGVPDRRLRHFAALYETLIADREMYLIGDDDGLSDDEYQQLQDLRPVVRQKAAQLAGYPIPQTLHHGDLHDGNIFASDAGYRFFDWGDASLSHPFFSLRTTYISAEMRFNLDEDSPALDRLQRAYLAAWRDYADEPTLNEIFALARELWAISTALIWHAVLRASDDDDRATYAHALPSLMRELLQSIQN